MNESSDNTFSSYTNYNNGKHWWTATELQVSTMTHSMQYCHVQRALSNQSPKQWMNTRQRVNTQTQGLKYNFQGEGTVQLWAPQFVPGLPFISWAFVLIVGSQIINDRLNLLSMISCCFFSFVKFCKKNIQHCEFMVVKCEILNDLLTVGLL